MTLSIDFAGETLALLPERAAWWPRARTLFVADTHFGKAAAFRHAGVPVPETITRSDVERLEWLCAALDPAHLIFLGDFFHAPTGRIPQTEGAISSWRERRPNLRATLVRGNHDRASGDPPARWDFQCVDPGWTCRPFSLVHAPEEAGPGIPTLCGHVHPGVVLRGAADGARLACFFQRGHVLILPAFGRFTGLGVLRPKRSDRVWVVTAEGVIDASPRTPGPDGSRRRAADDLREPASSTQGPARYHPGMTTEAKPG